MNLAVAALCRDVGEDASQLHRWRHGDKGRPVNPKIFTVDRTLSSLEAALDKLEAEIFFALAPQFMGDAATAELAARHGFDLADHVRFGEPGAGDSQGSMSVPAPALAGEAAE